MVSKDQAIGWLILLVCAVIALGYLGALAFPSAVFAGLKPEVVQFWLIAIPVVIAFIAVLGIGAWIGWTMATTPPPKPIEEIEAEEKKEEEKAVEEEKKE